MKINKIKNILLSIYYFLIFIRANPSDFIYEKVLKVYIGYFKDKKINMLLNELIRLEDFPGKTSIIKEIKKWDISFKRLDRKWILLNYQIFEDSFNHMLNLYNKKDFDKIQLLPSSLHNYPDFLLGKYKWPKEKYWQEHICYYKNKTGDKFLDKYESMYSDYYNLQP